MVDESSPTVIHIVFELSFIDMIVYFSTQSLHLSISIDLSKATLIIVFRNSHMVINWIFRIADDIFSVEDAQFVPLLHIILIILFVMQDGKNFVVLWLRFEFFNKSSRKIWRRLSCGRSSNGLIGWNNSLGLMVRYSSLDFFFPRICKCFFLL